MIVEGVAPGEPSRCLPGKPEWSTDFHSPREGIYFDPALSIRLALVESGSDPAKVSIGS
ncbi:hypothetical protein ACWGR4_04370 [Embleya sp. NPDC055664]